MDIFNVHSLTSPTTEEFFEVLGDTENLDYFKLKSIKKIIDYKWPLYKEYIVKKLFIPFLCYQLTYMVYCYFIQFNRFGLYNDQTGKYELYPDVMFWVNMVFLVALIGLSMNVLSIEFI